MPTTDSSPTSTGQIALATLRERDARDVIRRPPDLSYLCETADVVEGEGLRIDEPSLPEPIAVFRSEGEYFALSDTCSHAEASLSEGLIENGS